jgi:hypothetical protein
MWRLKVWSVQTWFLDVTDTDGVMGAAAVGRLRLGPLPLVVCSSLAEGRSIVCNYGPGTGTPVGGDDHDAAIRYSFI